MIKREIFELELKQLIVETLALEEMRPEDIDSNQALFVEGLGLDSIDALELAVAISKKYQVKIEGKNLDYREVFASVHSLASFIISKKGIRIEGE